MRNYNETTDPGKGFTMEHAENKTVGFGRAKPADTAEYAEITLSVQNSDVAAADFVCSNNKTLQTCAQTLCRQILGFPAADILQINNNIIYYNLETDLPREELYLASVCVLAAKRAAADWMQKNGLPVTDGPCGCV